MSTTHTTNIHALAAEGNADALRQAHRAGTNIHAPDWAGRTPLHWVSVFDHPKTTACIGVLLRRGANLDARDKSGRSPEDWARESGNTSALRKFRRWRDRVSDHRAHVGAQAGFTLFEAMLTLSVLSIVAVGGWALFFSGADTAAVVNAQADTSALASAAASAYVSRANFAGLSTSSAMAEGWIPQEVRDANGRPVNAWGSFIALSSGDLDQAGDAKGLRIEEDVPTRVCAKYIDSVADDFEQISVNDTELLPFVSRNPARLIEPCAAGGDTAHVVLVARHS
jgi:prepilin-type N-terminal cleavage/methylation domain-containing protein